MNAARSNTMGAEALAAARKSPMSTEKELAHAAALVQRGAALEAERILRRVLVREPDNADAIHLQGLLRKKANDGAGALELLRRSIRLSPRRPDFHGNVGNLLRNLGRHAEAEAAYRTAVAYDPGFRAARLGLARLLNEMARPIDAEAEARALIARDERDAEAWAALGESLSARRQDIAAEAAYRRAVSFRPGYAVARHNLGALLIRQRRAEEALSELDRAAKEGVQGRELALNRARALFDLGRFDESDHTVRVAVATAPLDTELHRFLAKLRHMRGDDRFTQSIEDALEHFPGQPALIVLLADLMRQAGQLDRSEALLRKLLTGSGPAPETMAAMGLVLQDQGRYAEAEQWARRAYQLRPEDSGMVENLVVLLIALGRGAETLPMIEAQRTRKSTDQRWLAYLATAARQLGRPEYGQLYDYDRFVQTFDLEPPRGWGSIAAFHADLIPALDERHRLATRPLDQSLRHGTQTPRSLLADKDPVIESLLSSLQRMVARYRETIGFDPAHPYLQRNHGEAGMVGCWSVRLQRGGYHVNHIHPAGWISSAYYVQLPAENSYSGQYSGWIKFGEFHLPVAGLEPAHQIQPREGRLVLFPSYMWHGTVPIAADEPRITVAFDMAPL